MITFLFGAILEVLLPVNIFLLVFFGKMVLVTDKIEVNVFLLLYKGPLLFRFVIFEVPVRISLILCKICEFFCR